jgi:molybdate transport system substrate-binding protein
LLLSSLWIAGCSSQQPPVREKITVLAAASTADAMERIADRFQVSRELMDVEVSTGASNNLAQQIIAGAPADVFLSANEQWADAVAEKGLTLETVDLLTNRMVLVAPKGNPAGVEGPSDLLSDKVSRVAVAGENVPAGIYAEQALRKLKLYDRLHDAKKLARGADVRVALAYVERGEAEAGIVYATDARITDKVEVVAELDPETYDRVVYSAVLLKAGGERAAARNFFEFLKSPDARMLFAEYGFTPVEPPK